jgi:phage terminase small subunit
VETENSADETATESAELTPKQEMFCREYIKDLNGTQAAIRAGYSEHTAGSQAHDLLKKPEISARVQQLLDARSKRLEITADRVLNELAKIAFADMRRYARWNASGVEFHDSESLSDDECAAIQEITETTNQHGGSLKVKLHDKKGALELLSKHLKLLTEKHEHSGPDGGPIPVSHLSDDQLDARILALQGKASEPKATE